MKKIKNKNTIVFSAMAPLYVTKDTIRALVNAQVLNSGNNVISIPNIQYCEPCLAKLERRLIDQVHKLIIAARRTFEND
jgi:hypothetical protein